MRPRNCMISWIPSEIRWLSQQVRPFLRWHAASFVCISVGSCLALLSPLVLKWMIDVVLPSRRVGLLIGAVWPDLPVSSGPSRAYDRRRLLDYASRPATGASSALADSPTSGHALRRLSRRHTGGRLNVSAKRPIDEISFLVPIWCLPSCGHCWPQYSALGAMLILNPRMTLVVLPLIPVFLLTRKHFRDRLEVIPRRCSTTRLRGAVSSRNIFRRWLQYNFCVGNVDRSARRFGYWASRFGTCQTFSHWQFRSPSTPA